MANFDEQSGIISCTTTWGKWWQTIEEVFIEVLVPEGIKSKEICVNIKPKSIKVEVQGREEICWQRKPEYLKKTANLVQGSLFATVHADESIWTLEDKKLVRICLPKSDTTSSNCWKSLLESEYIADPHTFDQMEQKLTLQRFQLENPGFDFSGASITGNYHNGGPALN